jgi:UDPglucose--hexose-1-phosphate uridylyltransferase
MSDPAHGVWEERWHPLREEWVIIAAHRQDRPWSGGIIQHQAQDVPRYLLDCYLCPGNTRISGARNPDYQGTFVFDNNHPCVGLAAPAMPDSLPPPYRARRADGVARVISYSPRHDLTVARMAPAAIAGVVRIWQQQTWNLGHRPEVRQAVQTAKPQERAINRA